jgi:hypothetical protein
MDLWLVILVVAIGVASRPIVGRLWRTGRLSDRSLSWILVGRFPVLVGLIAIVWGASLPIGLFAVAVSLLSGLILYRFMQGMAQDRAAEREDLRTR